MTIVLGFDESPGAHRALAQSIELARTLGEDLVIVYGVEPPSRMGEEWGDHLAAITEQGRRILQQAVDRATAAGVTAQVELVDQKPAEALVAAAEEHDARMIVVGTYGESPLKGAILGATPHRLLHLSHLPVLCVPAPIDQG